jgi:hypothetical protein
MKKSPKEKENQQLENRNKPFIDEIINGLGCALCFKKKMMMMNKKRGER